MRTIAAFVISLLLIASCIISQGCSQQEVGQTLSVSFDKVLPNPDIVYSGSKLTLAAEVIYKGSKTLSYNWTIVSRPSNGGFEFADVKDGGASLTLTGAGTYVMRLYVYETNGTISTYADHTFTVVNGPLEIDIQADNPSLTLSGSTGSTTSGTITISANIIGGTENFSVNWGAITVAPTGGTFTVTPGGFTNQASTSNRIHSGVITIVSTSNAGSAIISVPITVVDAASTTRTVTFQVAVIRTSTS